MYSWRPPFVGNKAKRQISKRVLQENKVRQIFRKTDISYCLISTPTQGFPSSVKGWGVNHPMWGKLENFAGGWIFLLGGGKLRRSDFDYSNLFQS